jgi:integrase
VKRDLPPYVVRLKGVIYFKRRGWPTRRFENQELGDAFWAEYARILNAKLNLPKAFLVRGLIDHYTRSHKFTEGLKPRTQRDYLKFLIRFEKNAGTVAVATIERKHIIAWRDQLAKKETPHFANYWVRVVRLLLEHAVDIGEIKVNPASGVGAIKYQKKKPQPWPKAKIEAARDALPHSHRTRLLFEMLYCTGQRIGDVLAAEWSDIQGPLISVRQNKTDASLVLPITDELAQCLRMAERHENVSTILANATGSGPWSYRGAHDAMMKLRKEIGAEANSIHDIRHTVASEIVEAGGTDEEGMAITGHTTKKMFAHYSASTRQKARAQRAHVAREQNKDRT